VTSTPLHPALVHLPLGLAFLLPLLTLGFAWALWKSHIRVRSWLLIVILQAVLLGAGFVAMNTGEREGERVERVVPHAAIEQHEELAEQFIWTTGTTLAIASAVLLFRRRAAVRALSAAAVIGTFVVAAAALRVGHAGGQLVYVHNAGAAYTSANNSAAKTTSDEVQREAALKTESDRHRSDRD
jgi:uncharacterized membrane protein